MIRRPPRSTQSRSSAASDVYKRQTENRPFEPKTTVWLGYQYVAISGPTQQRLPGATRRMTSVTEDLRLAADFAPATYDDWRRLVDGVLKGAPFEKLVGKTSDGLKIDPIYPRARGAAAIAGRPAAAPSRIMQRIEQPDAGAANAQALRDLA